MLPRALCVYFSPSLSLSLSSGQQRQQQSTVGTVYPNISTVGVVMVQQFPIKHRHHHPLDEVRVNVTKPASPPETESM